MAENKEELSPNGNTKKPDPNYWRSFEQLYRDPAVIEASRHEFKSGVTDDFDPNKLSGLSRRKFLALLGASAALAGAGCSNYNEKGELIPYNNKPEEITVGAANFYSTTGTCPCGCGLLVRTREGRPIKIDGNPDHPVSRGKVCTQSQASILNLYDPERISGPRKRGSGGFQAAAWSQADKEIMAALNGGGEIAVIAHRVNSPTALKAFNDFKQKYPSANLYSYELFSGSVKDSAWKKSYGSGLYPLIQWDKAKVILSLEGDFLGADENKIENARLFAAGRDVFNINNFNRLYAVEGNMSVTGINADYRMRLKPELQHEFVLALIDAVNGGGSLRQFAERNKMPADKLNYLVNDLTSNRGTGIVYAGKALPEDVHIAVNHLNEILGNSALYRTDQQRAELQPLTTVDEWNGLISRMNSGGVGAVIHFDSNPVYHFASDSNYKEALKKVKTVVTLTEAMNESAAVSGYVLPINHALESWGDYKTRTGFYSFQQPVIRPLHSTRQKEAILLTWASGNTENYNDELYHQYLLSRWENEVFAGVNSGLTFQQFWNGALHDGVAFASESVSAGSFNAGALNTSVQQPGGGYTVMLAESFAVGDGRYAANGWLQEVPHPVSKITWDNYAAISEGTAKELDLENYDMIEIDINGKKLEIPVFLQPGSADKTITIELGYGREEVGVVGQGVGFNANKLLSHRGGLSPWLYTGAKVRKTGDSYKLATAQEIHVFDDDLTKDAAIERNIIKPGTVAQFKENPNFLHEGKGHELHTFYPDRDYTGVKWGMAIDLNKCLGCSACVVACQSENNIPVVGKEQVMKGREMHWLRIDRYYSGEPDEPNVHLQPMLCQHCDHAPCEVVCPVSATTHSPDGLNQMVYNRCVGTRYCSNNCPYKVRRFNYFNFRDHFAEGFQESDVFNLIYNPEVTVRSRGVMEKCTFCIQRIMEEREDAIKDGREVVGKNVTTACQDACITNAISFGDINTKDTEFHKNWSHELGYFVLEELNARPNVTYLAKLRNSHSEEA